MNSRASSQGSKRFENCRAPRRGMVPEGQLNCLRKGFGLAVCFAALLLGCKPPGKPTTADIELKPEEVRDFAALYQQNCVGCHGQDGKGNSALALANPVSLAIASDDVIRRAAASGVRDSLMPAFARSSGGMLTDDQIEILVHEM